jgi:hypothetical protein
MSHRDREARLVGELLQLLLPQPISGPIGATSICGNEQLFFAWIKHFAEAEPPPSDTLDGKLSGIMIDAHVHKAPLMDEIIPTIRHGFPIGKRKKVLHIHAGILSGCLPFTPIIRANCQ